MLLLTACVNHRESRAEQAVILIEKFQREHNRLPDDLREIGMNHREDGPVYYRKNGERDYTIWYGTRLGSSVVYESKTRQWREVH